MIWHGLKPVLAGVALGVAGVLVPLVVAAAALRPARAAARVDPTRILRYE